MQTNKKNTRTTQNTDQIRTKKWLQNLYLVTLSLINSFLRFREFDSQNHDWNHTHMKAERDFASKS
jgi:hypothetical protein